MVLSSCRNDIVLAKGLSPDPDKMSAIQDFLIPVSKGYLRSWLGLCQQLSMWYLELASCQSGLRHLVRDDVVFHWTVEMTEQMEATKRLICGDVYVQPYDTMLVPTIYVDGSILYGSGFILVQQDGRFFLLRTTKSGTMLLKQQLKVTCVWTLKIKLISKCQRERGVKHHPP